jgi:neutral ceramidase
MALRAGFGKADITPPVGTHKIGWLKDIVSDEVLDPLYARAAVLAGEGCTVAFIQLDTLFVLPEQVAEIRRRIKAEHGIPGMGVMVAATHNHAGPAVAACGDVLPDEEYVASMLDGAVSAVREAVGNAQEAEVAFGRAFDFEIAHNRRIVMRDGTVRTHGTFDDPEALYIEGPMDPEVAVLAARRPDGHLLGTVVNFACHPTHHGGDTKLSAGFPGVLADELAARGCPDTVFLNGASGNITDVDPGRGGARMTHEEIGRVLAEHVEGLLAGIDCSGDLRLGAASATMRLPFRQVTEAEKAGTTTGAQRFIDPAIYERAIPGTIEMIRRLGKMPAEVQAIFVGDRAFVGVPAEYFVQLGLRIKEECHPRKALVVSCANGSLGYVPHADAFRRGGYETTFTQGSCLAPEAGDMLADCAIKLVRNGPPA